MRILTESMPYVRSATVGVWVGVGSRDESSSLAGSTHFLEHLLFKGTRRRTAMEISSALEAVGGELNAFTGKEVTCYHARVLDADLPLATGILMDMVTSSRIASRDVEAERQVILDEIAMHDDDPDDAADTLFARCLWGDAPLGRPVLGSPESIAGLSREQINGYYRRRYSPERIVVAAAGNLDHDRVVADVVDALGSAGWSGASSHGPAESRTPAAPRASGPAYRTPAGARVLSRSTEQAHLMLGLRGLPRTDERRYALGVLDSALGGGTSSRLFQEVREQRGLAYSIWSHTSGYADTGLLAVSAGCLPSKVDEVLKICREQIAAVAERGITSDELSRGQGALRGGLVLGLEDTAARMFRIAQGELGHGKIQSIDEVLARIDAVTLDDVRDLAAELLRQPLSLAVVGPFDDARRFEAAVA